MRFAEQIKEYIECPQTGSKNYGKWGALTSEQRITINKLCDECLMFEETADKFGKENIQLKKTINTIQQNIRHSSIKDVNKIYELENQINEQNHEIKVLNLALEMACDTIEQYQKMVFRIESKIYEKDYAKEFYIKKAKEKLNGNSNKQSGEK